MSDRYTRQELFPEIGTTGQKKLLNSRVLLVGCGALGSLHAEMLSRAGVGRLRIVDRDFVEFTNLQRQTLFKEADAEDRLPKAAAAKARIAEINSDVDVEPIIADVNNSNIERLLAGCDLVLDGTDNFQIRYLLNDACVKHSKTWIYGAAVSSYGSTMTIIPNKTPCLRCIFEEIPDPGSSPTCETAGVIMPIISVIGSIQVSEALKLLTGNAADLHRTLTHVDVWKNEWRTITLGGPNPDCRACGERNFEFLDAGCDEFSAILCGRDAVQIASPIRRDIDLERLADRLSSIAEVKQNEYLVRLNVEGYELTVFSDSRAIIRGTADVSIARSLYAKYIGS
ncbi:MAG: ThiF family adenylyltransferase [Pyrinomonadaceae bacterium]